jgi:hypothetical protein
MISLRMSLGDILQDQGMWETSTFEELATPNNVKHQSYLLNETGFESCPQEPELKKGATEGEDPSRIDIDLFHHLWLQASKTPRQ